MRESEPTYSRDDLAFLQLVANHDGPYACRGGERKRATRLASPRFRVLTVKRIARAKGKDDLHASLTDAGRCLLQRIARHGGAA